jgi:hypothetical protein
MKQGYPMRRGGGDERGTVGGWRQKKEKNNEKIEWGAGKLEGGKRGMTEKGRVGREWRRRGFGGDFEPDSLGGKLSRAHICKSFKELRNRFPV